MKFKHYINICFLVFLFLGYEYLILNHYVPLPSLFELINRIYFQSKINLSPIPGKTMSYTFGIIGFSLMILMNIYMLRKNWGLMRNLGNIQSWLNFHIFCGILGPIFILYHSNFKVGGLVSISFWCMVVSASSGVVGRYFYLQKAMQSEELKKTINELTVKLKESAQTVTKITDDEFNLYASKYLKLSSGVRSEEASHVGVLYALFHSFLGDLILAIYTPKYNSELPLGFWNAMKQLSFTRRKLYFLDYFKTLMGYWHSFHTPFAVFMYVIAILHIFTALIFGVKA